MILKEIMTDDVMMVSANATLKEAAHVMKELHVHLFPVCDQDRLIGAITDEDIMIRAVAEGRDPSTTKVREIMTEEIFFAFEDQEIKDAVSLMKEKQIRRLLVFNRNWKLTGIISLDDLAAAGIFTYI